MTALNRDQINEAYIELLEAEIECLGSCIDELAEAAKRHSAAKVRGFVLKLQDVKNNLNGTSETFKYPGFDLPDSAKAEAKKIRQLRAATLSESKGDS